jgi:hypothetical protein
MAMSGLFAGPVAGVEKPLEVLAAWRQRARGSRPLGGRAMSGARARRRGVTATPAAPAGRDQSTQCSPAT